MLNRVCVCLLYYLYLYLYYYDMPEASLLSTINAYSVGILQQDNKRLIILEKNNSLNNNRYLAYINTNHMQIISLEFSCMNNYDINFTTMCSSLFSFSHNQTWVILTQLKCIECQICKSNFQLSLLVC